MQLDQNTTVRVAKTTGSLNKVTPNTKIAELQILKREDK